MGESESLGSRLAGWFVVGGIIAVFVVASLALVIHGGTSMWESYQARNWPQAVGHIIHSEAIHERLSNSDGTYWWKLVFEYEANGKIYLGDRFSFARQTGRAYRFSLRSVTYDLAEGKYHAGDPVAVYHHPDDPQQAVLNRQFSTFSVIEFLIGLLLCIAIAVIVLKSFLNNTTE